MATSPSSLSSHELDAAQHQVLSLRNQQLTDPEFAIFLQSFKSDPYFAVLDARENLLTDEGARLLAEFITNGCSVLEVVHLEENRIGNQGGEWLEAARQDAFRTYRRNWVLHLSGNPMSGVQIARLEDPISLPFSQVEQMQLTDSAPFLTLSSSNLSAVPHPPEQLPSLETLSSAIFPLSPRILPTLQTSDISHTSEVLVQQTESSELDNRAQGVDMIPIEIREMTHLKRLALGRNRITEIENLPNTLEALELCYNEIEEMEGLEAVSGLLYLDLSHNRIREIKGLKGNSALRDLRLGYNFIQKVTGIDHLQHLKRLDLQSNRISSYSDIRALSENSQLRELILHFNPICQESDYTRVVSTMLPKLKSLDAVQVEEEHSFFSISVDEMSESIEESKYQASITDSEVPTQNAKSTPPACSPPPTYTRLFP